MEIERRFPSPKSAQGFPAVPLLASSTYPQCSSVLSKTRWATISCLPGSPPQFPDPSTEQASFTPQSCQSAAVHGDTHPCSLYCFHAPCHYPCRPGCWTFRELQHHVILHNLSAYASPPSTSVNHCHDTQSHCFIVFSCLVLFLCLTRSPSRAGSLKGTKCPRSIWIKIRTILFWGNLYVVSGLTLLFSGLKNKCLIVLRLHSCALFQWFQLFCVNFLAGLTHLKWRNATLTQKKHTGISI